MLFILNIPIIYHATQLLIMNELWLIITHIFHYHELQINLHLPCLAHKPWEFWGAWPPEYFKNIPSLGRFW